MAIALYLMASAIIHLAVTLLVWGGLGHLFWKMMTDESPLGIKCMDQQMMPMSRELTGSFLPEATETGYFSEVSPSQKGMDY